MNLKKENEAIKDRIIRDIKTLFRQEDYYKPVRAGNFWDNNYIEYESNGERNKNLSIKEYLEKIKHCLKDNSSCKLSPPKMWQKIQLTIAVNFIHSKDKDKEHLMHLYHV